MFTIHNITDAHAMDADYDALMRRCDERNINELITTYHLTRDRFHEVINGWGTNKAWSLQRDITATTIKNGVSSIDDSPLNRVLTATQTCATMLGYKHPFLLNATDPTSTPQAALAARDAYRQFLRNMNQRLNPQFPLPMFQAPGQRTALTSDDIAGASIYIIDDDIVSLVTNLMLTRPIDPTWLDLIPENVIVFNSAYAAPFASSSVTFFPECEFRDKENNIINEGTATYAMQAFSPIIGTHCLWRDNTILPVLLLDNLQAFAMTDLLIHTEQGELLQWMDSLPNTTQNWAKAIRSMSNHAQRNPIFPALYDDVMFIQRVKSDTTQEMREILRESIRRTTSYLHTPEYRNATITLMLVYLAALFALMRDPALIGQERQVLGQRPIPKSERRYDPATGRRIKTTDVAVTTVHLSQGEGSLNTCSETERHYSHRWIVSGHWRMQPCGPHQSERKRIWINPHVQGPADKPLIIKDRVTRVRL